MKQFLHFVRNKAEDLIQLDQSMKDRPLGFRILVGVVVGINLCLVTFCIIKTLS